MTALEDTTLQLMQDKLEGAEKDTENLAKMLLDLGINPSPSPEFKLNSLSPDINLEMNSSFTNEDKANASKEKSVRFLPPKKSDMKSNYLPSILKKKTIKPLQVNLNSLNQTKADSKKVHVSSDQYSKLVSRLCKTESIIQSLKLSMCAMKTAHESTEREKSIVIDKLKEEIKEQEFKIKQQQENASEEQKRSHEHLRRWEEAEDEVKELQQRLQQYTLKSRENYLEEEHINEKYSRKVEEAKQDAAREKEVRIAIEDSHLSLLSRVQDMEDTIQHERSQVEAVTKENDKLKSDNDNLKKETSSFYKKAKDLEEMLSGLKTELDTKEKAIRKLIEEQHQNQISSASLSNQQATLSQELKQCNIVLDVQKAALAHVEKENIELIGKLEKERRTLADKEQDEIRKEEEDKIKTKQTEMRMRAFEERLKANMDASINNEKQRCNELQERNKLLEQCIKKQEKAMEDIENQLREWEKEQDAKLFEEKKKTARAVKEKDQALKAKESALKDLGKVKTDISREKELLNQRIEEMKLDQEATLTERSKLQEENQRLLNRIGGVEQQEEAFKRAQDLAQNSSQVNDQLSYENGKLKAKVTQLEEELRSLASVRSQVLQLRATNQALEQKFSQVTSELATSKIDSQRNTAHVEQLQSGMSRKEADFNLAISARDEAIKKMEEALAQVEALKEQEKNRLKSLNRELSDTRADNERMGDTVNQVTSRHAEIEKKLHEVQRLVGKKDAELQNLRDQKQHLEQEVAQLRRSISNLEGALSNRDEDEERRIGPAVQALEEVQEENTRLTSNVSELKVKNSQLRHAMNKYKNEIEAMRGQAEEVARQQENKENNNAISKDEHSEIITDLKETFGQEKVTMKKQMQSQINELKKAQESSYSRNAHLLRGNTELRSKLAERELNVKKLNEKIEEQKLVIERQKREKKHLQNVEEKLRVYERKYQEMEMADTETSKRDFIRRNKQQCEALSSFNREMAQMKNDVATLNRAQKLAKENTAKLENDVCREKLEKQALIEKLQVLEEELERANYERHWAKGKLRQVEYESIQAQENLLEAQIWFQDRFGQLHNELAERGAKRSDSCYLVSPSNSTL